MVPGYPFPMTTSPWPEYVLSAHPNTRQSVRKAVAEALYRCSSSPDILCFVGLLVGHGKSAVCSACHNQCALFCIIACSATPGGLQCEWLLARLSLGCLAACPTALSKGKCMVEAGYKAFSCSLVPWTCLAASPATPTQPR